MEHLTASQAIDRILSRATRDEGTGCLIFQGHTDKFGHGRVHFRGIGEGLAHRALWVLTRGDLGDLHLHHVCERPACVNLDHLKPVTPAEHAREHHGDRCPQGHEPNFRVTKKGRECRTCDRDRKRRERAGLSVRRVEHNARVPATHGTAL